MTAVGSAALIAWYAVLAARITQSVMLDLRLRIFRHTQRLSLDFHETYTSGRIISRQTSDLDTIRELLDGGLNELVSGVLFGGFTLIALIALDWQSGAVLVLMGVPLALLMRWFYLRSQIVYRRSRVVSAKVIVHFVETMTGIRAVKAFRTEPRGDREFRALSGEYRDVNMASIRLFGTFEPGLMAISSVTLAAVVLWGGIRVANGALDIGILLAAVLYVRNFFSPLQEVAMFLNSYQSAAAALEKVSGVLEEEPSVAEPRHPVALAQASGHLRFEDVAFAYSNGRTILPISPSTSRRARRSRSSARRGLASRRSRSSSHGSTTRRAAP